MSTIEVKFYQTIKHKFIPDEKYEVATITCVKLKEIDNNVHVIDSEIKYSGLERFANYTLEDNIENLHVEFKDGKKKKEEDREYFPCKIESIRLERFKMKFYIILEML